jgi:hypothetical protein
MVKKLADIVFAVEADVAQLVMRTVLADSDPG